MTNASEGTRQGKVTVKVRAQQLDNPYVGLIVLGQTDEGAQRSFKTVLQNIAGKLTTMGHFGQTKLNTAGFKGVFRHCQFTDDPKSPANISSGERAHRLDWEWNTAGIIIDTRRAKANGKAIDVNSMMAAVACETRHGATLQQFVDTVVGMTDSPVQIGQVVREQQQALIDEIGESYSHRQIFATLDGRSKNLYRAYCAAVFNKRAPEGDTQDRRWEATECLKAVLMQRPSKADAILAKVLKGLEGANVRPVIVNS